jgi:hypothetical protein
MRMAEASDNQCKSRVMSCVLERSDENAVVDRDAAPRQAARAGIKPAGDPVRGMNRQRSRKWCPDTDS